ncbi:hypothetical protein B7494_g5530 [Chlorociboria aeruginascens]|nr:hypothetical protein B7494_g5530 [Chlorociboria aeruginascens]
MFKLVKGVSPHKEYSHNNAQPVYQSQTLVEMRRVTIVDECIEKFNELKLNKKIKYIIYKLSDDDKQIVVETTSEDNDWEAFRQLLINATSKKNNDAVGPGPRYAVFDVNYELTSGEGSRSKITFIAWSPDDAPIKYKMLYASSKEALKRCLTGIAAEIQANDSDDLEYSVIIKIVSKGAAA